MGWRTRENRSYYYESERCGAKVRTRYVGTGYAAGLISRFNEIGRDERYTARADETARIKGMAEADARLGRYFNGVELAFQAAMEAAGHHRQGRHRWRKRRMTAKLKAETPALAGPEAPKDYTHAEIVSLVKRANGGNQDAAKEFRDVIRHNKTWRQLLLDTVGSPAHLLIEELLDAFHTRENPGYRMIMEEKVAQVRDQITPPDAGPLEKLLAERVATCWLAVNAAEARAARHDTRGVGTREMEALARRTDRAHKRFLSALQSLATLRKADAPGLTVNVLAQQAVNVQPATSYS